MTYKKAIAAAAVFGASGVMLGAFAAHFLKEKMKSGLITEDQLNGFDTASKYQLMHAIVLLLIALLLRGQKSKWLNASFYLIAFGIILFSGSIYLLSTRQLFNAEMLKFLGPVTPLGGLSFISGWVCLLFYALNKRTTN